MLAGPSARRPARRLVRLARGGQAWAAARRPAGQWSCQSRTQRGRRPSRAAGRTAGLPRSCGRPRARAQRATGQRRPTGRPERLSAALLQLLPD
eukprot:1726085-Alexandrium_andersonii.AAC.1